MTTFENGLLGAQAMLKRFALSLLRNEDEANDAVQETMLRALANREQFTLGTNLQGWLVTILRNYVRGSKRKGARRDGQFEGPRILYTDYDNYADHIVDPGNPEKDLIDKETFFGVVCRLPEKWHEAVLRAGLGFSQKEMARDLQIAEGTVKSRVFRARERLALEMAS